MTYISRDPFAREEIHRESLNPKNGEIGSLSGCAWCGQRNRQGRLFRYRLESDGGRRSSIGGLFCSVTCMKTYHNWSRS